MSDLDEAPVEQIRADGGRWSPVATITKYATEADYEAGTPYAEETFEGNLLTNAGIDRMLDLTFGLGATQAFDATHLRIGVGDSSTAAAASQTDLQAATNKQWKTIDSRARSAETVTIIATFGTSQANFAWAEWAMDQGTADGTTVTAPMLNRKVASMGTKASGAVWVFTVTATLA